MLREPQHERKIINDIKSTPFVLSHVEGLREGFSATCYCRTALTPGPHRINNPMNCSRKPDRRQRKPYMARPLPAAITDWEIQRSRVQTEINRPASFPITFPPGAWLCVPPDVRSVGGRKCPARQSR